jgi:hypothetical protein
MNDFRAKKRNFFDFRVNTPTSYPESGSRKHFHALGVCAIDFPHKITHLWVIFSKKILGLKKFHLMKKEKKHLISLCFLPPPPQFFP